MYKNASVILVDFCYTLITGVKNIYGYVSAFYDFEKIFFPIGEFLFLGGENCVRKIYQYY